MANRDDPNSPEDAGTGPDIQESTGASADALSEGYQSASESLREDERDGQTASGDYQDGQTASGDYPAGQAASGDYPSGSDRSGVSRENHSSSEAHEIHGSPEAQEAAPDAAEDDWLKELAEVEDRMRERERRLLARNLNVTESMLLEELEAYVGEERPRRALSYQVGVRLGREYWNRLVLVARWSGVPPTTMARILINRGARAIIDEELRHRRDTSIERD